MLTYGSYLKKKENLVQTTAMVTAMDTGVAILAGVAMFLQCAFGMNYGNAISIRCCSSAIR